MSTYIDTTPELGKAFYQRFIGKGKVVMLNLLKFNETADYTLNEHLRPQEPISGEQAYALYMEQAMPELTKAGSRILYYGTCHSFLIGPDTEKWDAVLLVEHASVPAFMQFAQNPAYLNHVGHRTAALQDSRLLPSSELPYLRE